MELSLLRETQQSGKSNAISGSVTVKVTIIGNLPKHHFEKYFGANNLVISRALFDYLRNNALSSPFRLFPTGILTPLRLYLALTIARNLCSSKTLLVVTLDGDHTVLYLKDRIHPEK